MKVIGYILVEVSSSDSKRFRKRLMEILVPYIYRAKVHKSTAWKKLKNDKEI